MSCTSPQTLSHVPTLSNKEETESEQYVLDSKTSPLRATQHKTEHVHVPVSEQAGSVGRREAQNLKSQEDMYVHQLKNE